MIRSLSQFRKLFENNPDATVGTECVAMALVARDHGFCNMNHQEHEDLYRCYHKHYRERLMHGNDILRLTQGLESETR